MSTRRMRYAPVKPSTSTSVRPAAPMAKYLNGDPRKVLASQRSPSVR
ncbi:hypothetical protein STENM327S_07295 [Streptomyces tendae]